jgi:aromatic-L-amino-acid/L-tryptophan decarboxylase
MSHMETNKTLRATASPIEISPEEFRRIGHEVIDQIADFLKSLPERRVTPHERPSTVRAQLPKGAMPEAGQEPGALLRETEKLLFEHSLFNGHPRFWGYISSSAAPIGALGDLLAATVNPNVGGWGPAPIASEIEGQVVRWIAELLGYPSDCGGILVSGGNMANFVGILAARRAQAQWDVRKQGLQQSDKGRRLRLYASQEAHTWVQKVTDLFGFGTDSISWISTDDQLRMNLTELRSRIRADREGGDVPFAVVGTAGTVSSGAIDPLPELAAICREESLWFHVDGAYGGLAAMLSEAPPELKGLREANSVAIDPHKWLYVPLEAGCILVRKPEQLRDAFSYRPAYYRLDEEEPAINYHEYGPQNSRSFRALKVWLALRQAGRAGYQRMIGEDIALARELGDRVKENRELELGAQGLSITTFRYRPSDRADGSETNEKYLNDLNGALLLRLQESGEAYVSNAVIRGKFYLRACIVNFRTTIADINVLPALVIRLGSELHREGFQQPP